jgi:hypothetical protein
MAQSSWPFENIDTTETQYSQLFRTLNNGVNGTPDGGELEVGPASAGLAVDIAAGQAMVRGHFYSSTEVETRSLATADATNDRIDLVVLRLDPIANTILLAVKTGVPDPAPVAPGLVQTDGGIFEQPLANVLVPANAGVPSTITDRREFMGTKLGTWTTDGRPTPAGRVLFGFNTTLEAVEFYDPINEVWGPVAPEINSLDDIGDVTITTPADGQVLTYDNATSEWINEALPQLSFTASTTITATDSSWPVPTLASPIVKVTVIGAGGGGGAGDNPGGQGGTGGTTTFNAGGAGTVTAAGGVGGRSSSTNVNNPGGVSVGFASANGGTPGQNTDRDGSEGNGGLITVAYLDLTGISTVNVEIGAGGAGAVRSGGSGSAGGRGEVIVEYVAG